MGNVALVTFGNPTDELAEEANEAEACADLITRITHQKDLLTNI